jgi:hypothetical protein
VAVAVDTLPFHFVCGFRNINSSTAVVKDLGLKRVCYGREFSVPNVKGEKRHVTKCKVLAENYRVLLRDTVTALQKIRIASFATRNSTRVIHLEYKVTL